MDQTITNKNPARAVIEGVPRLHFYEGGPRCPEDIILPVGTILELVKLSDQARIGGHRRMRARLYYAAGFDTLDKIAALEPEELRKKLAGFIEQSGFEGIAPTPKEAAHSVALARTLPRIVEYQPRPVREENRDASTEN